MWVIVRRSPWGGLFGTNAFGGAWKADGKETMCDASLSASQADLSKKPTRVSPEVGVWPLNVMPMGPIDRPSPVDS